MKISNGNYDCPHCGSENTRKLSLINRDGISRSSGIASVGNKIGNFNVTRQTASSRMASAPIHPSKLRIRNFFIDQSLIFLLLPILFLFSTIISQFTFFALRWPLLIISIGCIFYITKSNKSKYKIYEKEYPTLLKEWDSGYQCQRCEKIFTIGS